MTTIRQKPRTKDAIRRDFDHARKALAIARGRAKDDGMFAMRATTYQLAVADLRRAEKRYETARLEWEAAGRPNRAATKGGAR